MGSHMTDAVHHIDQVKPLTLASMSGESKEVNERDGKEGHSEEEHARSAGRHSGASRAQQDGKEKKKMKQEDGGAKVEVRRRKRAVDRACSDGKEKKESNDEDGDVKRSKRTVERAHEEAKEKKASKQDLAGARAEVKRSRRTVETDCKDTSEKEESKEDCHAARIQKPDAGASVSDAVNELKECAGEMEHSEEQIAGEMGRHCGTSRAYEDGKEKQENKHNRGHGKAEVEGSETIVKKSREKRTIWWWLD